MAVTALSGQRWQGSSTGSAAITPIIDGSDTILKFTESGTFTPAGSFNVEYLVVGGAGGGGYQIGGGGGAGAYRANGTKDHGVTAQTYTITVGTGGAGSAVATADTVADSGISSIFNTITSVGGGGGASHTSHASDSAGGSGGGAADHYPTEYGTGGSYGNDGGEGTNPGSDVNNTAGGGGGSGGTGGDGTDGVVGGAGGIGTANDISGESLYYAGGGGGGAGTSTSTGGGSGGSSIGGDGGGPTDDEAGGNGTINTGSGGGGGAHDAGIGGNGSAGVVIIRFTTSGNSYTTTMGTQDDKSTVTDVPDGSEFEQTNDYKTYQRFSSTGNTHTFTETGGDGLASIKTTEQTGGCMIDSGHTLIGTKPTAITFSMYRDSGLSSGTCACAWRRTSDATGSGTPLETSDTVNNTTLTTSTSGAAVSFAFDGTYAIEAGDYFLVESSNATGSQCKMVVKTSNGEANAKFAEWKTGSGAGTGLLTNAGYDTKTTVTYNESGWRERGTAI